MRFNDKDNLSLKAYDQIKNLILNGDLKQGQAISINLMADQLGISRTPVTNACQKLEYEKLLTILPKQGVIINTISIEDACGIYELRAAIESYNAKRVMDILTNEDIQFLKESVKKQTALAKAGNSRGFMEEDHAFHKYILEKSIHNELLDVIRQLYDRAYILGIKNSLSDRLSASVQEHNRIIEALEQKDRQAFADAIEENILNGFRSLTAKYLK